MKDRSDLDFILNYTDKFFYRLALSVACRSNISLAGAHEESWVLFGQGVFRLQCGDDDSEVGIVPSHSDEDRRAAIKQNKTAGQLPAARSSRRQSRQLKNRSGGLKERWRSDKHVGLADGL